ncbi:hypothetical protein A4D02_02010 [Niastella koreensis]|uniref:Uncharacterized protein n=2 Tax=Niastella koreensis TaxID=354356 RepID=G8THD0_NIAKG|nr:hypothetical protein Niako_6552 [Niastella koreensis GR20-10]OQP55116.1 hypothetical protein A4D02_02010 [Niastella koreensis]
MLVRRWGAGFSEFSAARTLIACNTKLASPEVYHAKNVQHQAAAFPGHLETPIANFGVKV